MRREKGEELKSGERNQRDAVWTSGRLVEEASASSSSTTGRTMRSSVQTDAGRQGQDNHRNVKNETQMEAFVREG